MSLHEMYRRLSRKGLLFFVGLILIAAATILAVRAASSDNPQFPPSTTVLLDANVVFANSTVSDRDEQADQQALQDAPKGLDGLMQAKDGSFQPSISNIPDSHQAHGVINQPVPEAGWGALYHISNGWTGSLVGHQILASAGSKVDNYELGIWNTPEQGMLVIDGNAAGLFGEYLTPTRTGIIHVTVFSGSCLTLLSTSNTVYNFNVATRAWSCSSDQPPSP